MISEPIGGLHGQVGVEQSVGVETLAEKMGRRLLFWQLFRMAVSHLLRTLSLPMLPFSMMFPDNP